MASLSQRVSRDIAVAHSSGLPVRLDETNSVARHDKAGVSDSFASALATHDVRPQAKFSHETVGGSVDGIQ